MGRVAALHTRHTQHCERGAGVFSMSFGLLIFFLLLLFAVQILYNLYATSVVSGLAIDAARDAAEFDGAGPAGARAEFLARAGPDATINFTEIDGAMHADVTFTTTSVFPAVFDAEPFGVLKRTFVVRVEEQQAGP